MFGQTVWERHLHQAGQPAGLAVSAEHIVVHERWTRLVGLDPRDGARRWDVPIGTWPRATVIAGERCLVIPQDTRRLCCLDVRTGEVLWTAQPAGTAGHLTVTQETVLVGGWRGYTPLTAFDLRTGVPLWQAPERVEITAPVALESGVLIGEPHGREIRLIDPRDGRTLARWSLPEPLAQGDVQPVLTPLDSDRFLARCGSQTVLEISLSTGAVTVFHRSGSGYHELAPRALNRTGPVLWAPAARRLVQALDAHDGRPLRLFAAAEVDHPVRVTGGYVVADSTGWLALVDPDPEAPSRPTQDVRIAQRIRALRPHGPDTVLVLTKGTLRVVEAGAQPRGGLSQL